MRGKHLIKVSDNRAVYELTIKRNITIIRGDSATGKTTLLEMLDACLRYGDESGIHIECDVPVAVFQADKRDSDWEGQLSEYEGSIVFIEELNSFVRTREFAEYVSGSRSYFVLITRWNLKNLAYSVEEIYTLTEKGKYPGTKKIFNSMEQYYSSESPQKNTCMDKVAVEDAKAGYEFYQIICRTKAMTCESVAGNANIIRSMRSNLHSEVLYIADGAAFDAFMDDCMSFMRCHSENRSILWLPESFEYLILASGIPEIPSLADILKNTYNYVDSENYVTWEKFYTELLVKGTRNTEKEYSKGKLADYYKGRHAVQLIMRVMPERIQNVFRKDGGGIV